MDSSLFTGNLISSTEASKMFGYTPDYVARLCREGKIKSTRVGRAWLVDKDSLAVYQQAEADRRLEIARELSEPRAREYRESQSVVRKVERVFVKPEASVSSPIRSPFFSSMQGVVVGLVMLLVVGSVSAGYYAANSSSRVAGAEKTELVAAVAPAGNIFDAIALFTYETIERFFDRTGSYIASFVSPTTIVFNYLTNATSAPAVHYGTTTQVVYGSPNVTNEYSTYITGASADYVEDRIRLHIDNLDDRIDERLDDIREDSGGGGGSGSVTSVDASGGTTGLSFGGGPITSTGTLTLSGTLNAVNGGTGHATYAIGDILYADSATTLARLPVGAAGQVLKISAGVPSWSTDLQGSGGAGAWATTSDNLAVYPADSSNVVIIGAPATTTTGNILEVAGNALFRNTLTAYGTISAPSFTATTTAVNTFPNASFTNATTTSFGIGGETFTDLTGAGLQNIGGALSLNATGDWTGTFDGQEGSYYLNRANHTGTQLASTISDFASAARVLFSSTAPGLTYTGATGVFSLTSGYSIPLTASTTEWSTFYTTPSSRITAGNHIDWTSNTLDVVTTGDWTGTFDGQEGSYYLANGFSTTSANYWQTTRNFFSTTSADYWETQQTARTADDLSNNSIEDLSDVASMTEATGDLLSWNGSTWTNVATSSLGLQGTLQGTTGQVAFFSGTNQAVGTSNIFITPGGNVGIGTTTAGAKLEVAGAQIINGASDGSSTYLQFKNAGANTAFFGTGAALGGGSPNDFGFYTYGGGGSGNFDFYTAGNWRMRISDSGVIATGTILAIGSADGQAVGPIIARSTGGNNVGTALTADATDNVGGHKYSFLATGETAAMGAGHFAFYDGTADAYRMIITSTGDVGIGTTSPSATLSVQGSQYTSGTAFFGGALTATSTANISGLATFGAGVNVNAETLTDLTGTGLTNSAGALTLDATGDWTGTFDGQEGSYYLANSFSTTSANYWETQQTARTADDLSNNSIEDLSDVAAMTEDFGDLLYWNGTTWADIATSSLGLSVDTAGDWTGTFDGQEGSWYLDRTNHTGTQAASTISDFDAAVNAYIHASTTIPKTYTSNTFGGVNTFENLVATNATTTYFAITGIGSSLLKTDGIGRVVAAVDGTDYLSSTTQTVRLDGNANLFSALNVPSAVTTGNYNVALGYQALPAITTGQYNVAFGIGALQINETGSSNVALGVQALQSSVSGWNNIAFGGNALQASTGSNNIAIGAGAGDNLTSGDYNIAIGSDAEFPSTTGSYQLNIGNILYGDLAGGAVGIGTTSPSAQFAVQGTTFTSGLATFVAGFNVNGETFTDLTGTGLTNSAGALTLDATGDWTGTFDGQEGSYYLDRTNHTGTQAASTISDFDAAVNAYISASTTIPKTYSANLFTDAQTLNGGLTLGTLNGPLQANNGVVSATTSIGVLYGGTGLTTAPTYGQMLVGNSSGGYTLTATSSLGLATFAYPFSLAGNATSTLTQFNGGLTAYASSTIGGGTRASGLTVFGGATTTGTAYFAGALGVGTNAPTTNAQVANTTLHITNTSNFVDPSGGEGFEVGYDSNGQAGSASGGSGAAIFQSYDRTGGTWQDVWFRGSDIQFDTEGAPTLILSSTGRVGVGTTSPYAKLSVVGQVVAANFTATTTAVNTFPNALFTNATTTSFGINSETFTDLTGTGLQNTGGALTLNATGDWTGMFDGQEGSYYLSRANHTGTQLAATISDFDAAVNTYIAASSSIPKTFAANTFTGTQTFGNLSATNATTTSFGIGSETFTDLTGTGLANIGGVLTATLGTSVDIGTEVSGVLPIANGGTGASSFNQGSVIFSNGTTFAQSTNLYFHTLTNNLGVGTNNPENRLTVSGGASIGENYVLPGPTNGLIVEGFAGFGTSSPYAQLSVDGDAVITGNLYVGGSSTLTVGTLTGPLQAINGAVSATTSISSAYLDSLVILSTEIDTSSELAGILGDETGTGSVVFSASPTFTGTPVLPSTFTIGANSFIRSGAHNLTITTGATTNVTLPSGTVTLYGTGSGTITSSQLATSLSDETGSGLAVFSTSPIFNTVTNSQKFYVSRTGSAVESLSIGVDDGGVYLESIQDEDASTSGGMTFIIDDDGTASPSFLFGGKSGAMYMSILETGNVGVGTVAPRSLLDVSSTTEKGNATLTLSSGSSSSWATGNSLGKISFYNTDTSGIGAREVAGISVVHTGASTLTVGTDMTFSTGPLNAAMVERLRIASGGNVGIGSTSPAARLVIGANSSAPASIALGREGLAGQASTTAKTTGDEARLEFYQDVTAGGFQRYFDLIANGSNGTANANMRFFTNNGGSAPVERVRIDGSGNVGIGTTTPWGLLSVNPNGLAAGAPQFVVGSSTATNLIVTNAGHVGVGSTEPNTMVAGVSTPLAGKVLKVESLTATGGLWAAGATTANVGFVDTGGASGQKIARWNFGSGSGDLRLEFINDAFSAVSTTSITFANSGNVGIGTTNPTTKLSVSGGSVTIADTTGANGGQTLAVANTTTTGTNYGLVSQASGSGASNNTGIYATASGATNNYGIRIVGPSTGSTNYALYVDATAQSYFAGSVGIGRSDPPGKLTIGNTQADGAQTAANAGISFANVSWTHASIYPIGSSGFNGGLVFATDGDSTQNNNATEKMRITPGGNVGIGTTDPQDKLHISGGSMRFDVGANNGIFQSASVAHANGNVGSLGLAITDGGGYNGFFVNNKDDGTYNSQYLTFFTGQGGVSLATERMRITETGNVGIGTSTPAAKLHVNGSINLGNGSTAFDQPSVSLSTTDGADHGALLLGGGGSGNDSTRGAYINLWGNDFSVFNLYGSVMISTGRPTGGQGANIFFNTDTGTGSTVRASVSNAGAFSVVNLASCAGIQTNGSGTMSCTSDQRQKDVQGDFTRGLAEIRQLKPVAYTWKESSSLYDGGIEYIGFLAQEVQRVIPEAVNIGYDDQLQLQQFTLVTASINAIKELDLNLMTIAGTAENPTEESENFAAAFFDAIFGKLIAWFENAENGIANIFVGSVKARDTVCVGETCVTEDQLKALLEMADNQDDGTDDGSDNGDDDSSGDDGSGDDTGGGDDGSSDGSGDTGGGDDGSGDTGGDDDTGGDTEGGDAGGEQGGDGSGDTGGGDAGGADDGSGEESGDGTGGSETGGDSTGGSDTGGDESGGGEGGTEG